MDGDRGLLGVAFLRLETEGGGRLVAGLFVEGGLGHGVADDLFIPLIHDVVDAGGFGPDRDVGGDLCRVVEFLVGGCGSRQVRRDLVVPLCLGGSRQILRARAAELAGGGGVGGRRGLQLPHEVLHLSARDDEVIVSRFLLEVAEGRPALHLVLRPEGGDGGPSRLAGGGVVRLGPPGVDGVPGYLSLVYVPRRYEVKVGLVEIVGVLRASLHRVELLYLVLYVLCEGAVARLEGGLLLYAVVPERLGHGVVPRVEVDHVEGVVHLGPAGFEGRLTAFGHGDRVVGEGRLAGVINAVGVGRVRGTGGDGVAVGGPRLSQVPDLVDNGGQWEDLAVFGVGHVVALEEGVVLEGERFLEVIEVFKKSGVNQHLIDVCAEVAVFFEQVAEKCFCVVGEMFENRDVLFAQFVFHFLDGGACEGRRAVQQLVEQDAQTPNIDFV